MREGCADQECPQNSAAAVSCKAQTFRMEVAGLTVDVAPLHDSVRRLCEDYLVAPSQNAFNQAKLDQAGLDQIAPGQAVPAPDLSIAIAQADIDAERATSDTDRPWSDAYLETLAVLRVLSTQLPQHRRFLVHGAVIQYAGRAYLFTAPSGTGKSTHIRLWRECVGSGVRVINGDKPFVFIPEAAGEPAVVYGTPWAGKEGWQENAGAPLAGIALLSRSKPGEPSIRSIDAFSCLDKLMHQVYLPNDAAAAAATLELLDELLARTPLYSLACDISEEAVRTSFEALTGLPYRFNQEDRGSNAH